MAHSYKHLIICCDGLWDTTQAPTNTAKLSSIIHTNKNPKTPQIVFYDSGHLHKPYINQHLQNTFGLGIKRSLFLAYQFLSHNYEKGDKIFCFGASKGAQTLLHLIHLLDLIGLLPKEELHLLEKAYQYYLTPVHKRNQNHFLIDAHTPPIHFLGLWDSVGAQGVPVIGLQTLSRLWLKQQPPYLPTCIDHIYHAIALDERRPYFHQDKLKLQVSSSNNHPHQNLYQAWFPGNHADVTGGTKKQHDFNPSLHWMITQAQQSGLSFDETLLKQLITFNTSPNYFLDLKKTLFNKLVTTLFYNTKPREIQADDLSKHFYIHKSVSEYMKNNPNYRPSNINANIELLKHHYEPHHKERRQHFRVSVNKTQGTIETNHSFATCEILNYSIYGGVQIKCDNQLKPDTKIIISSPSIKSSMTQCVWANSGYYGLQFLNIEKPPSHSINSQVM